MHEILTEENLNPPAEVESEDSFRDPSVNLGSMALIEG